MVVDKLLARNLMTRQVQTVTSGESLMDVIALMEAGDFGQVPVVEARQAVGLVTEQDVRRALLAGHGDRPVGELMSPVQAQVRPTTPLSDVLMTLEQADSLLVVAKTGRLMGIITYWDVLVLARPYLLTTEIELNLRRIVSVLYEREYGSNWWRRVPKHLRDRAEEEHARDAHLGDHSSDHMLGHTSFWTLIEILRDFYPALPDERYEALHEVREFRNKIAHHYRLTKQQIAQHIHETLLVRDWLHDFRRDMNC